MRVGDRILLIVAFGQHGVERRNRTSAALAISGALHELGEPRKHGGRIALGGRRLTDRKADLTLRLGKARQRIHQQQHLAALLAKIFGNAVASLAPCRRINGGVSAGAATTTARLRSSGPRIPRRIP